LSEQSSRKSSVQDSGQKPKQKDRSVIWLANDAILKATEGIIGLDSGWKLRQSDDGESTSVTWKKSKGEEQLKAQILVRKTFKS